MNATLKERICGLAISDALRLVRRDAPVLRAWATKAIARVEPLTGPWLESCQDFRAVDPWDDDALEARSALTSTLANFVLHQTKEGEQARAARSLLILYDVLVDGELSVQEIVSLEAALTRIGVGSTHAFWVNLLLESEDNVSA